jgi:cysteinyl-tRNA synthetase
MVQIDEEKMSKSVGNIFQLSEALDRFGGDTVVAYLASGHYRQPLAFSEEALDEASARVGRIRNFGRDAPGGEAESFLAEKREEFLAALADDFNTPQAFAVLFEVVAEGNRRELSGARGLLEELLPLLGLDSLLSAEEPPPAEAERLLSERQEARAAGEFERADAIREHLGEMGWEVRDEAGGARLVRRR